MRPATRAVEALGHVEDDVGMCEREFLREEFVGLESHDVAEETESLKLSLAHPDIVFNMAEGLHGPCRESHVPALCEYLNIPYTGSDPLTLALTLHKGRTKEILAYRGVPTAPFRVIERVEDLERLPLPYPLFVKPVAEGSGKGIFVNNLCETPAQLAERVPFLLERYSQPVLVETYLPGPEFTVAILGNNADRKSTRLNSSHLVISYAVFCLKKKKTQTKNIDC